MNADDIPGVDDDVIATWAFSGDTGFSATQSDNSKRPKLKKNIIGAHAVARFDGSNDTLTVASFAIPTNWSLFVVCNWDTATPGNRGVIASDAFDQGTQIFKLQTNAGGTSVNAVGYYSSNQSVTDSQSITDFRTFRLYEVIRSTTGIEVFVNAVGDGETTDAGVNTNATQTTTLGCTGNIVGLSGVFGGDIAEVVFYDTDLSVANRQAVESYFNSKYVLY